MSSRKTIALAASVAVICSAAVVAAPAAEAKSKQKAPGKVSSVRVTGVTASSAVLSWHNPKSKKSAKFVGTVVRVAAGAHAPKSVKSGRGVANLSGKRHAVGVAHLAPGTAYTVSIFSSGGKKHYSKPVAVHLQTAPAAVAGLYAQATTNSLSLGWQSPSRSAVNAIVRYAVGRAPTAPNAGYPVAVHGHTAAIGGLRFGTAYGVSVWAIDRFHHLSPRTAAVFRTAAATSGGISGVITESGTNKPLRNAEVELFDYDGDYDKEFYTGANGTYSFTGVKPGKTYAFRVYGDDVENGASEAGYVAFRKNDIEIKAGDPQRISVVLQQAAGVTGTVVGADDPSAGIEEAEVYTTTTDDSFSSVENESDENGSFTLTDIDAALTDGICFNAQDVDADSDDDVTGYQEQCLDVPDDVELEPGKITDLSASVGDVELEQGGAIAGTAHLAGEDSDIDIEVLDADGNEVGYGYGSADQGVATYKAGGLAPGTDLYVCAYSEDDAYQSRCYDGTTSGVAWDGDDDVPSGAHSVQVQVGQTKKNIDFTLPEA